MNIEKLDKILSERKAHPDSVYIGNNHSGTNEQYCLLKNRANWEVYYSERGQKGNLHIFDSESEACEYLLSILLEDQSVWLN